MATINDLAKRVLQKLQVLAAGETASAEDQELIVTKLKAVHEYLRTEDLLRWTWQDLPAYAEEPYVMMAAFLAQEDYGRAVLPQNWSGGLTLIQSAVARPVAGSVRAEYF